MGLHDEDISKEEILKQGLATPEEYETLEKYTLALFKRGTEIAAERGLILVDTKYEFGKHNGTIYLMERNPHSRLKPLFLLGRLRRTLCKR